MRCWCSIVKIDPGRKICDEKQYFYSTEIQSTAETRAYKPLWSRMDDELLAAPEVFHANGATDYRNSEKEINAHAKKTVAILFVAY